MNYKTKTDDITNGADTTDTTQTRQTYMDADAIIEHINYLIRVLYTSSDPQKIWKLKQLIHAYEHKLAMLEV